MKSYILSGIDFDGEISIDNGSVYIDDTKVDPIRIKTFVRTTADGVKFNAYKAVCSNGRYLDLSFTKEKEPPKDLAGKAMVILGAEVRIDTNRLYPRVYVLDYITCIPFNTDIKDTLNYVRSGD